MTPTMLMCGSYHVHQGQKCFRIFFADASFNVMNLVKLTTDVRVRSPNHVDCGEAFLSLTFPLINHATVEIEFKNFEAQKAFSKNLISSMIAARLKVCWGHS